MTPSFGIDETLFKLYKTNKGLQRGDKNLRTEKWVFVMEDWTNPDSMKHLLC